jgi:hypothetical protein
MKRLILAFGLALALVACSDDSDPADAAVEASVVDAAVEASAADAAPAIDVSADAGVVEDASSDLSGDQ